MLLQACVWLDRRGSVWPGGKGKATVCVGETGQEGWLDVGTNRGVLEAVGARSAVVCEECVSRVGRERV